MSPHADWHAHALVVLATMVCVGLSVLLHYEGLNWMSRRTPALRRASHRAMLLVIFALLLLHVAEIWIFGIGIYLLIQHPEVGQAYAGIDLFDAVYFSATSFSTAGFGNLVPQGPIRFLIGTESLAGLMLVAWSASFTYLEMSRYWHAR